MKKQKIKKIRLLLTVTFVIMVVLFSVGCSSSEESPLDKYNINVSSVRNDVTGNWKETLIAEDIEVKDIAVDYYKEFFENDDQIHAIINFSNNTTNKLLVNGDTLDLTVYEYVEDEEHDASTLYSGTLLKEYYINIDTGEIEEIQ